jgi:polyhydroxybutyrate depolymerase
MKVRELLVRVTHAMRAVLVTCASLALAGCATWGVARRHAPAELPGTAELELQVGDLMRTYLLHVPEHRPRRFGRAEPYPLVIVLHGSGASGQTVRDMSRLDSLADATPFLVAYPDATRNWLGLQSAWNSGACCGPAVRNEVDDIGFVRALIAHIAGGLPVDRRRIYVAGFSDGGRMAYRLGCTLSSEIAAIGVVAGSLMDPKCTPARAVPLIAFHGTADTEVAFADSSYSASRNAPVTVSTAVPPAVSFWAANNACKGAMVAQRAPTVTRVRYSGCAADVVFFSIAGGGHAWPGGDQDGDDDAVPTRELFASAEMTRFFLGHSLP